MLLVRPSSSHIVAVINDERVTYILPEQQNDLHSTIFGTDNQDTAHAGNAWWGEGR